MRTTETKATELQEKLAKTGLVVDAVQVGSTIEIVVTGTSERSEQIIADLIKKGLKAGQTVKRDGVEQWVHHEVICDLSKRGSEQAIWDASGNRCKHRTILYTRKDGEVTSEQIGTSYRKWD